MTDDERRALEVVAGATEQVAREHAPHGCAVATLMRAVGGAVRRTLGTSSGPAQVATKAYRDGWETIFGSRQPAGQA